MLRTDSPGVRAPSVCLVTPGLGELTAGIGAATHRAALELAGASWRVHVLVADGSDPRLTPLSGRDLERAGIAVTALSECSFPASVTVAGPNHFAELHLSEQVRHALTTLHQRHHFRLIDFPDRGALGFRTVQAKQAGLAFADVALRITVYGPNAWLRRAERRRLARADEAALDYCERYAFEHADRHRVQSDTLRGAVHTLGWNLRPETATEETDSLRDPSPFPKRLADMPLVTVGMPCFNLGPCLDEALASLASQSYPAIEVIVIDDGSTEPAARDLLGAAQERYPRFLFLRQDNAGISATRNRALAQARGRYFLPMDGDNIAHPEMVARLVAGLERRPELAALTCDFLAFLDSADIAAERFLYAYRPTGGPHLLGCLRNVYGDGNALFRTDALRAVGGFEPERDASWEDWEVFLKLVHAGYTVDVLPAPLFYYRHRQGGFSRISDPFANQQRVLRQYQKLEHLPPDERAALWELLMAMHERLECLGNENRSLRRRLASRRYRLIDRLHGIMKRVPLLGKTLRRSGGAVR